jgi:hypothetical protein
MNNSKAMGIGAMMLFLVLAVVFLPMVVRFIDKMEPHYASGFENMSEDVYEAEGMENMVNHVPSVPRPDTYHPDANTDYMCSSPNGNGESCPEGTFCDGSSQSCVKSYVGGDVPDTGYFS